MAKKNKLSAILAEPNVAVESGAPVNTNIPHENAVEENASALVTAIGSGELTPESQTQVQDNTSALYKLLPKNIVDRVAENVRGAFGVKVDDVNNFSANALGMRTDENGVTISPSQQTIDAIIFDGVNKGIPREQTDANIDAANQLDSEIINDTSRFEAINNAIKKELDPKKSPDPVINLTVDDFEFAANEVDDAIMSGDENWKRMAANYQKALGNSKVNTGEPAMERLGLHDYYPDINTPLQVGSYSGSIVGSNPIFVAGGGYIPFGVIDARKRALERAAKDKAIKKQKIAEMMWAKGAPQYQNQIDQMSVDMLDKYAKATNNNFSKLLDFDSELSMQFNKDAQKIQTFGVQTKAVQGIAENLLKQQNDDKLSLPSEVTDALYRWHSGVSDMQKFYDDPTEFANVRNQLRSYDSMIYAGDQVLINLKTQKDKSLLKDHEVMNAEGIDEKTIRDAVYTIHHGNYDEKYWAMLKFVDEKRIDQITNAVFSDKDFYVGNPKNPESVAKAKLQFKQYLVNSLSKETDFQQRMINHGDGFLNFKRQTYNDQKKKEAIWTTIYNRATENQEKLAAVAQGVTDPAAREEQMRQIFTQTGINPLIDRKTGKLFNGELVGNVDIPQDVRSKKVNLPVSKTTIRSPYDGKQYDIYGYQAHLKAVFVDKSGKVDYNKMSDSDKYMFNLKPDGVVDGLTMVAATQQYQYRDASGKLKNINVNDGADKWQQSSPTGTLIYGGNVSVDAPVYGTDGKQIYGVGISYVEDGKRVTMVVPSGSEESELKRLNKGVKDESSKARVFLKQTPMTQKKNIGLPYMSTTTEGVDDINVAIQNQIWSGASQQHLTGFLQEGATFEYSTQQPDNTPTNQGEINLNGE